MQNPEEDLDVPDERAAEEHKSNHEGSFLPPINVNSYATGTGNAWIEDDTVIEEEV